MDNVVMIKTDVLKVH